MTPVGPPAPPLPKAPPEEVIEALPLLVDKFAEVNWVGSLLSYPPLKAVLPVPILAALAPLIWLVFRKTWQRIDWDVARTRYLFLRTHVFGVFERAESSSVASEAALSAARSAPASAVQDATTAATRMYHRFRLKRSGDGAPSRGRERGTGRTRISGSGRRSRGAGNAGTLDELAPTQLTPPSAEFELSSQGDDSNIPLTPPGDHFPIDFRPAACFVITAVVLTMQEYYGGRHFYDSTLHPFLEWMESSGLKFLKVAKYHDLYGYAWWSGSRIIGYVLVPVPLWLLFFPKDSVLDMGLRTEGFFRHLWIYGLCLAVVVPVGFLVAQQPDFGTYYPFYKSSSRSWFDFLAWECIYFGQFLALEFFFRGWMIAVLRRTLGIAAIFAMAVPYCMIHYGKPYLEAHGAIVAGVVLGSLAMKTRSIYAGFLLHITVAFGMDFLALYKRGALPTVFWAGG